MDHSAAIRPSAEYSASDSALSEETGPAHRAARTATGRVPGSWPLLAVLAVQAVLSFRLVRGRHGIPG